MDKNKKLKIALPILIVVMAFVWGPIFFGSNPKDKADNKTGDVGSSVQGNTGSFNLAALSRSRSQEKSRTVYADWGQNPFMLKRAPRELYIEGIMWDKTDPKAIINGDIVGIGETVESKTIVDITSSSVIFKDGDGKEFELSY